MSPNVEKTFSLFNVSRWGDAITRPSCCSVVPVLWTGVMLDLDCRGLLDSLATRGSTADPTCKNPEGIVIFHTPSRSLFKMTLDKNDAHRGG